MYIHDVKVYDELSERHVMILKNDSICQLYKDRFDSYLGYFELIL